MSFIKAGAVLVSYRDGYETWSHNPVQIYSYAIRNLLMAFGLRSARRLDVNQLDQYHPIIKEDYDYGK